MIRPLSNRLLVRPLAGDQISAGGLLFFDQEEKKLSLCAEVLAVGSGKKLKNGERYPPDVQVGDKVLYGRHHGRLAKINGEMLMLLFDEEVIGVVS